MSRRSLSKLPPPVRFAVLAYEKEARNLYNRASPEVARFVRHTSDKYRRFSNFKLLHNGTFNRDDFPPLVAQAMASLFTRPLEVGGLDEYETKELFRERLGIEMKPAPFSPEAHENSEEWWDTETYWKNTRGRKGRKEGMGIEKEGRKEGRQEGRKEEKKGIGSEGEENGKEKGNENEGNDELGEYINNSGDIMDTFIKTDSETAPMDKGNENSPESATHKKIDTSSDKGSTPPDSFTFTKNQDSTNHDGFESHYSFSHKSVKHTTDYAARLITTLRSHYDPRYWVPSSASMANIYSWFEQLVQTPVVLVLRQRQALFSSASLSQTNLAWDNLQQGIREASEKKKRDNDGEKEDDKRDGEKEDDKRDGDKRDGDKRDGDRRDADQPDCDQRIYHATPLAYTDLFSLALNAKAPGSEDPLAKALYNEQEVQFVDQDRNIVPEKNVWRHIRHPKRFLRDVDRYGLREVFPYDLFYSDFYLVTIEAPVVDSDHAELISALQEAAESGLEVIGARLSLSEPSIDAFFHQKRPVGYEAYLERARGGVASLMWHLGELGLVGVDVGGSSVTLTKK